jgi:hypothetical protein
VLGQFTPPLARSAGLLKGAGMPRLLLESPLGGFRAKRVVDRSFTAGSVGPGRSVRERFQRPFPNRLEPFLIAWSGSPGSETLKRTARNRSLED